jgi:hypothetical protein
VADCCSSGDWDFHWRGSLGRKGISGLGGFFFGFLAVVAKQLITNSRSILIFQAFLSSAALWAIFKELFGYARSLCLSLCIQLSSNKGIWEFMVRPCIFSCFFVLVVFNSCSVF